LRISSCSGIQSKQIYLRKIYGIEGVKELEAEGVKHGLNKEKELRIVMPQCFSFHFLVGQDCALVKVTPA